MVEDEVIGTAVGVKAEVADTLELVILSELCPSEEGLYATALDDLE